jgi:hypothetical protein
MRVVRRLVSLPRAERRMLLPALLTVLSMRIATYLTPTRWLLRRVLGRQPTRTAGHGLEPLLVGRAVRRAARLVPHATCLPQALATLWLMAGQGHTGQLRIGVRREQTGDLLAHAWVEHEGRIVVGDVGLGQFKVMPDMEGALWLR